MSEPLYKLRAFYPLCLPRNVPNQRVTDKREVCTGVRRTEAPSISQPRPATQEPATAQEPATHSPCDMAYDDDFLYCQ